MSVENPTISEAKTTIKETLIALAAESGATMKAEEWSVIALCRFQILSK